MPNNNPIDTWTREECEEYLKQYPKSLKSDAVRKRLRFLTPLPQPPKQSKAENTNNVVDAVAQTKGETTHIPEESVTKFNVKPQTETDGSQKQATGTTYVDEHENGMAVVGKVVLTILVFALCTGIILLFQNITGNKSFYITGPVSGSIGIPLINKIWQKDVL